MRDRFFFLYNFLTSILQIVGDSSYPLYYLIISSIVNVILDPVFILCSVALATIISQVVSAVLCVIHLTKAPKEYRLVIKDIHFNRYLLKQVISNGLPTGIQNSIIAFANVVVQSHINDFGKMAVASCGSYSKIEEFVFYR